MKAVRQSGWAAAQTLIALMATACSGHVTSTSGAAGSGGWFTSAGGADVQSQVAGSAGAPNNGGSGGADTGGTIATGGTSGSAGSTAGAAGAPTEPDHCHDQIQDADETKIDCGGSCVIHCVYDGFLCSADEQCISNFCYGLTGPTPSCQDGVPPIEVTRVSTIPGFYMEVQVSDFNGDPYGDVVVVDDPNAVSVRVYLGSADGTLHPAPKLPYTEEVRAIADVNGDGKLDLVTDGYGELVIAVGVGDGTFTTAYDVQTHDDGVFAARRQIDAADLDGDGDLDLAVCNDVPGPLTVWFNDGKANFGEPIDVAMPSGTNASTVRVGDFNEDGLADLVVTDRATPSLLVLPGTGDGKIYGKPIASLTIDEPQGIGIYDFNGDGHLDVAIGIRSADSVFIWGVSLGRGDGSFDRR